MNLIAINGSPRKQWSTAMLLRDAARGAESEGGNAELVHLSDLRFTGCRSCFACKKEGKSCGSCILQDDLTAILERTRAADAIILGTPVYYGSATSSMRAFLERLLYPLKSFDTWTTLFERDIPTGLIVTMGTDENGL